MGAGAASGVAAGASCGCFGDGAFCGEGTGAAVPSNIDAEVPRRAFLGRLLREVSLLLAKLRNSIRCL